MNVLYWDRDPDIPFLGIFVSKIRYFVFAVRESELGHMYWMKSLF
jgi:hypothetical protein